MNPRAGGRNVERFSAIGRDGSLTVVSVEERIAAGVGVDVEGDAKGAKEEVVDVVKITVSEQPAEEVAMGTGPEAAEAATATVTVTASETSTSVPSDGTALSSASPTTPTASSASTASAASLAVSTTITDPPSSPPTPATSPQPSSILPPSTPSTPLPPPFRDPQWQRTELAYHTLAITSLNALTRSYNLMSPKIAQKPYFTLQRELDRCFADVAPTLADEILSRSGRRVARVEVVSGRERGAGVIDKWGGHEGVIRDEGQEKGYGFREFWRDLFGKEREKRREKEVV